MKRVPLINSPQTAEVDDEDWPLVAPFRWRYWSEEGVVVAMINGELVEMGHLIMHPELAEPVHGAN